jgi:hypothetical protein
VNIVLRRAKHGCGSDSVIQRDLMMTIGKHKTKQRQRSGFFGYICNRERWQETSVVINKNAPVWHLSQSIPASMAIDALHSDFRAWQRQPSTWSKPMEELISADNANRGIL